MILVYEERVFEDVNEIYYKDHLSSFELRPLNEVQ